MSAVIYRGITPHGPKYVSTYMASKQMNDEQREEQVASALRSMQGSDDRARADAALANIRTLQSRRASPGR